MTKRFVLTGAMGSGKTPLLAELAARGFGVVEEPARAVLAEQRASDGDGVPDRNRQLFLDLMLDRAVEGFRAADDAQGPVFFDRGIPDMVGYAEIFGHDPAPAAEASARHRYDDPVFVLPSWREIYTTDDERTMTFEQARVFGDRIREVYVELGYAVVDLPKDTIANRAALILDVVELG